MACNSTSCNTTPTMSRVNWDGCWSKWVLPTTMSISVPTHLWCWKLEVQGEWDWCCWFDAVDLMLLIDAVDWCCWLMPTIEMLFAMFFVHWLFVFFVLACYCFCFFWLLLISFDFFWFLLQKWENYVVWNSHEILRSFFVSTFVGRTSCTLVGVVGWSKRRAGIGGCSNLSLFIFQLIVSLLYPCCILVVSLVLIHVLFFSGATKGG